MKTFIFLFCTAVFSLNSVNVFSQEEVFITKDEVVSVDRVFKIIKEQTNYHFIYPKDLFKDTPKIQLKKGNIKIQDLLNESLETSNLNFQVSKNNTIVISKKIEEVVLDTQGIDISGKVLDELGMPLPGANIIVKGTTIGAQTDFDGKFSLTVSSSDAILVVSYVGYTTREVAVGQQTSFNISLRENAAALDEVVVVGYGTQKKETLTGSVASVNGEELTQAPVTNVSQGIAGRLPGVVAISEGGEPGYDGATLRIRGVNTFGNSAPLVVVDGVPGRSLERIDPSTIKSISVLKDASAAIYGAQAANGVILVTTKRGTIGAPTIRLSYNQGFARPTVIPEMADAAEYATLLNEIEPGRYSEEDIQMYRDGSDPWGHPNTDWFAETLKPWSLQSYGNMSIDGGTENVKYFVSLSEKSQDGFYEKSATKYKQYDLRSNLDVKVNEYLDLYINTTGRFEDRNFPIRSAENIFRMLMRSKPTDRAYWPNGLPGPGVEFGDNPVVIVTDEMGYNRDKRYVLNSDFGANLKIPGVEGLTFKGTASLDKNFRFTKRWETPWYLYSWDGSSYGDDGDPLLSEAKVGFEDARLGESMDDSQGILLRGLLNYDRTFNEDHTINLMAGVERITNKGDNFSAFRRYFNSTEIDQLFAGGQDELNNNGSGWEQRRLNYFGRVNYSYQDKYLAEFVWRYQGSYIFEQSNRFGFFPGVSLGYVISKEGFWDNISSVINYAKIRTSWGQTGNDLVPPFQYLSTYSINGLYFPTNNGEVLNQAVYEQLIPNSSATWETAIQQNIGVDLQFFNGALALTADYFINKREDILWPDSADVPYTTGFVSKLPDVNIGKVKNQGVDFNIDYRTQFNDLSFGVGFNGVYSKNKILYWSETAGRPDYQQSTGRPIGSDLYYNAIGVFQTQEEIDAYPHWNGAQPGDIIFEDYNDDGVINADDRVRYDKSRTPTFTAGLNFDLSYKNFDLSVLFQGASGGIFYETTESGDFANYLKSFYDNRWTEANPSTEHPRTYNRNSPYWVTERNSYWLHKTDYIRLKNIELGYTIPEKLVSRFKAKDFRVYLSAFNLLTLSPDMKDYDPENTSGSGYNYPLNKVLNVGLSVTF
ncbi:TonB-dependent receptor [Aestuariibaculum sp. YM273]|uniref:TonB-dependent receptor n=1 Tax=Aestuariibaculum sp. YM273 TaxID=3070659 RepID=UPI0027DB7D35|nr:TonB-dependent receptor [Aestuariibaculum sp. YM273]WMI66768.1 TonB-dependent receptor [Aestuariibaculum sp. YM273]